LSKNSSKLGRATLTTTPVQKRSPKGIKIMKIKIKEKASNPPLSLSLSLSLALSLSLCLLFTEMTS
jgi:hypothetical protein